MNTLSNTKKQSAFTIVELLVVIVVIGILAGITIVSYTGISNKATIASMQSDLSNASKQFKMFHIENGYYPSSVSTNCTTNPTNTINLCLKPSPGNSFTTVAYSNPTPQSFILTEVNGNNTYHISESSIPTAGIYVTPTLATTDPANWLAIGTQVWAKYNLNVGTRIASAAEQTNNPGTNIVEKYCYVDTDAGCTNTDANGIPYGGLYQWREAMRYSTTEKAQGICPVGSHIPSDTEWKTLEMYLGMTQLQADATGWRGINLEGTKLKSGGSSGLNIPLASFRYIAGGFGALSSYAYLWSSSESGSDVMYAMYRSLTTPPADVYRATYEKTVGFSVRCVGN